MTAITTHVLGTARDLPVSAPPVRLDRRDDDGAWQPIGHAETDADGRVWTGWPDPFGQLAEPRPGRGRRG